MVGLKAKRKNQKKVLAERASSSRRKSGGTDFLPLEEVSGKQIVEAQEPEAEENTSTVLYIGHIPHGFYEDEMSGFFKQFGKIKRLRLARNRQTGKSKHYGFIEFENPDVAKIVADEMNNYLIFEHNLQVQLVPVEKIHPRLWRGVRQGFKPFNFKGAAMKQHNKERSAEEHQKLVKDIVKRANKSQKRIQAAGIEYECPPLVGTIQHAPKRIKFNEED